uniref:RanBP2-type domain-containing protein n=1 Tax=Chromera velia CCMP2878 TaxID=1169474 RepID=A0A0G4I362_9ALVE|eukprot:Cvel_10533.t1-p1 / transcript=Cvel_10533.t1 / gene=Cvel_10533 / organism=Chromera_velia_CCMP2878 / gene_product=hypothetical protein / transcript_product=hypothetical protein / location=Cvel_scaffold637:52567-54672(+) / protein_length=594 / sequence_SO=supercontig / SO=protein_coding / is_pseudo=false
MPATAISRAGAHQAKTLEATVQEIFEDHGLSEDVDLDDVRRIAALLCWATIPRPSPGMSFASTACSLKEGGEEAEKEDDCESHRSCLLDIDRLSSGLEPLPAAAAMAVIESEQEQEEHIEEGEGREEGLEEADSLSESLLVLLPSVALKKKTKLSDETIASLLTDLTSVPDTFTDPHPHLTSTSTRSTTKAEIALDLLGAITITPLSHPFLQIAEMPSPSSKCGCVACEALALGVDVEMDGSSVSGSCDEDEAEGDGVQNGSLKPLAQKQRDAFSRLLNRSSPHKQMIRVEKPTQQHEGEDSAAEGEGRGPWGPLFSRIGEPLRWACPLCSFQNPSTFAVCEDCAHPRPPRRIDLSLPPPPLPPPLLLSSTDTESERDGTTVPSEGEKEKEKEGRKGRSRHGHHRSSLGGCRHRHTHRQSSGGTRSKGEPLDLETRLRILKLCGCCETYKHSPSLHADPDEIDALLKRRESEGNRIRRTRTISVGGETQGCMDGNGVSVGADIGLVAPISPPLSPRTRSATMGSLDHRVIQTCGVGGRRQRQMQKEKEKQEKDRDRKSRHRDRLRIAETRHSLSASSFSASRMIERSCGVCVGH